MGNLPRMGVMPTKSKYKLFASFCMMSVMPLLVGVYIAAALMKSPLDFMTLVSVTLMLLFVLALYGSIGLLWLPLAQC